MTNNMLILPQVLFFLASATILLICESAPAPEDLYTKLMKKDQKKGRGRKTNYVVFVPKPYHPTIGGYGSHIHTPYPVGYPGYGHGFGIGHGVGHGVSHSHGVSHGVDLGHGKSVALGAKTSTAVKIVDDIHHKDAAVLTTGISHPVAGLTSAIVPHSDFDLGTSLSSGVKLVQIGFQNGLAGTHEGKW